MKITINDQKCTCKGIKLCATVCPYGFIWDTPKNCAPIVKKDLSHYCIDCGHCDAICPSGAVKLASLETAAVKFDKKEKISPDQASQFLKTRRSVRVFKDTPIPEQQLKSLMDITRWIPTASNKQQVKYLIYNSRDAIEKLAQLTIDFIKSANVSKQIVQQWEKGNDIVLRNAPHLIVVLGEKEYFWGPAEAGIALTYLELFAHANGFGTCWAGFFTRAANHYPPLTKALDLPDNHTVCGGIMVGYPVFKPHRIPFRKQPDIIWRQ